MGKVVQVTLTDFTKTAMKAYIDETVSNRSVPAYQDGLKPVQRRILWAMYKMGLFYNLSHRKSAKVSGEVIAKYNPHGDCLDGETEVYLANGQTAKIKDLVGKVAEVWCWDENKKRVVSQKASNFRAVKKDNLYTVYLSDGGKIKASGNHPVLLRNGEYKKVEELEVGDSLKGGFLKEDERPSIYFCKSGLKFLQDIQKDFLKTSVLDSDKVIHHIDHNPSNNTLENLQLLTRKEHALLHNDYNKGLENGRKSMFSDSFNPSMRRQIKIKNSELISNYNKVRNVLVAIKFRDWMLKNNIDVTYNNYTCCRDKKICKIGCVPKFNTLEKYGIHTIQDFIKCKAEDFKIPYVKKEKENKTSVKRKTDTVNFSYISTGFEVYKGLILNKKPLTEDSYNKQRETLILKNGLGKGNIRGRFYLNYENLVAYGKEKFIQESSKSFVLVTKVEKENGDFLLYDFTVPKYENMMIKTSDKTFTFVHNSSAYQAMVNMAQAFQKYNFIDGQGNWGLWSGEGAASSRYTECRLSEIAQVCLLDKDYLKVIPYVDNYDGTEKEPAFLPSRLPFILMLNIQGIATAVRTGLPSFELGSLVDTCVSFIKNKAFEQKVIPITSINGGKCINSEQEQFDFYKSGSGVLTFVPDYTIQKDRIEVTGIQDSFDFLKVSQNLLEMNEVKAVRDEGTDKIKISVYFNGKLDKGQIDKIIQKMTTKVLYSTNVLNNRVTEDGTVYGEYHEINIYSVLKNWCKFRINLEKKHINREIEDLEEQLSYQKTLLLASRNLSVVFKALQSQDCKAFLVENLKVNEKQADTILELPVKRLSRLSENETTKKIENLENLENQYRKQLENVESVVIDDLLSLKKRFS